MLLGQNLAVSHLKICIRHPLGQSQWPTRLLGADKAFLLRCCGGSPSRGGSQTRVCLY